jgi:hypothetical protein
LVAVMEQEGEEGESEDGESVEEEEALKEEEELEEKEEEMVVEVGVGRLGGRVKRDTHDTFRVSGFGFRVSGFGFRVSGFGDGFRNVPVACHACVMQFRVRRQR